jgi:hypothetical protein
MYGLYSLKVTGRYCGLKTAWVGNQNGCNVEILTWGIISFKTVESLIDGASLFREKLDIFSLSKVRHWLSLKKVDNLVQ